MCVFGGGGGCYVILKILNLHIGPVVVSDENYVPYVGIQWVICIVLLMLMCYIFV
jgi:hypothetical protein